MQFSLLKAVLDDVLLDAHFFFHFCRKISNEELLLGSIYWWWHWQILYWRYYCFKQKESTSDHTDPIGSPPFHYHEIYLHTLLSDCYFWIRLYYTILNVKSRVEWSVTWCWIWPSIFAEKYMMRSFTLLIHFSFTLSDEELYIVSLYWWQIAVQKLMSCLSP